MYYYSIPLALSAEQSLMPRLIQMTKPIKQWNGSTDESTSVTAANALAVAATENTNIKCAVPLT